ncbi:MAG TPA: 50S ribosomal protein L11 methyltransferase [Streptosporangiaceae bacterium]
MRELNAAGDRDSARDALDLLRFIWPGADLTPGPDGTAGPVDDAELARFGVLVRARAAGTPVARLTGRATFLGLDFAVTADVLVPREHTTAPLVAAGRAAVRLATRRTGRPAVLADAGTGSGNVVISIVAGVPAGSVLALATDLSPGALRVARANIGGAGLGQVIALARMDLVTALRGRADGASGGVDVLVANLPYLARPASRLASEPPAALLGGGADGLAVFGEMVRGAGRVLSGTGYLLLEVPPSQAGAALRAARPAFPEAVLLPDPHGVPRVLAAGGRHDPGARLLAAAIAGGAGGDAGSLSRESRRP